MNNGFLGMEFVVPDGVHPMFATLDAWQER
jgi:hypothetical protein